RDARPGGNGTFDGPPPVYTRVSVSSAGKQVTDGDDFSTGATVTADGRYASFGSISRDLTAGDTNAFYDVFLHDRDADGNGVFDDGDGRTTRRMTGPDGQVSSFTLSGDLSADGRYTALETNAPLIPGEAAEALVWVRDNLTGLVARVSVASDGQPSADPAMSVIGISA